MSEVLNTIGKQTLAWCVRPPINTSASRTSAHSTELSLRGRVALAPFEIFIKTNHNWTDRGPFWIDRYRYTKWAGNCLVQTGD